MHQSEAGGYILFAGPFVLAFIVLCVATPILMCFCICPNSCPTKACRKPEGKLFSTFDLRFPLIFTVVALLFVIGTSIAGNYFLMKGLFVPTRSTHQ